MYHVDSFHLFSNYDLAMQRIFTDVMIRKLNYRSDTCKFQLQVETLLVSVSCDVSARVVDEVEGV